MSAVAPAMLVSEMETQSRRRGRRGRRYLPIPGAPTRCRQGGREVNPIASDSRCLPAQVLLLPVSMAPYVGAAPPTRGDAEKDPVLNAMLEELDRSMVPAAP